MNRTIGPTFASILVAALFARSIAADESASEPESARPALTFGIVDLAGTTHQLGENDKRHTRAFVLLSTECPIANTYTKTLNELHDALRENGQPVDFYGVVSDPTVTRGEAAKH